MSTFNGFHLISSKVLCRLRQPRPPALHKMANSSNRFICNFCSFGENGVKRRGRGCVGHNNIRAFCLSHFVPGHAPTRPQSRPLSCLPLLVSLLTFGSVSFLFSSYLPPPLTLPRPACCLLLSPTLAASVGGGLCGRGGGGMERSRRVCGLWR